MFKQDCNTYISRHLVLRCDARAVQFRKPIESTELPEFMAKKIPSWVPITTNGYNLFTSP